MMLEIILYERYTGTTKPSLAIRTMMSLVTYYINEEDNVGVVNNIMASSNLIQLRCI